MILFSRVMAEEWVATIERAGVFPHCVFPHCEYRVSSCGGEEVIPETLHPKPQTLDPKLKFPLFVFFFIFLVGGGWGRKSPPALGAPVAAAA